MAIMARSRLARSDAARRREEEEEEENDQEQAASGTPLPTATLTEETGLLAPPTSP